MNYIIGIDTSSIELGIGLAGDNDMILGVSRYMRNSHAEHITRSIDFCLTSCSITADDISHAAIAVGPGSFTGLRIGISFLKGFCFGKNIKALPVSSLQSMAFALNDRSSPIVAAFDARNNEVFWARFKPVGNALVRTSDDALASVDKFKEAIDNNDIVVIDSLGYAKSSVFDFLKDRKNVFDIKQYPVQRGLACARIGMLALGSDKWISCSGISPRYLNKTTMEKKLDAKS
jgi:tRNA threonylcarbamoyladenosine biosynthesis protein TsaB